MNKYGQIALAGAAAMLLAGAAHAQNALGDGQGLDRNLSKAGTRNVRVKPDLATELRFRNAIVTGNAPGGLSFRGDVGYSASGEFTGDLGSNDLFPFRRDSLYSGLAGQGLRGTDALQYQFALTTGSRISSALAGSLTVSRSGTGFQGSNLADASRITPGATTLPLAPISPDDPLADHTGMGLWSLRSVSSSVANRSLQPSLMSIGINEQGQRWSMQASGLRGLSTQPLDTPSIPNPFVARPGDTRTDTAQPVTRNAYQDVLDRLGGFAPDVPETEDDAPAIPEWQQRLNELRQRLMEPATEEETAATAKSRFDPETIAMVREAPGQIDSLAPIGSIRNVYAEHMRTGQDLLAKGRYFDAEERFTRALAAQRGDAMAAVGRIHAQIGAGMFLSAATNIRALFHEHPELAGVLYPPTLLPDADRIADVKSLLRENIADEDRNKQESALVLAYIGRQTHEPAAVTEGLDTLKSLGPDALADLLTEVWTTEPEKPE
jgi:hypothetical protein